MDTGLATLRTSAIGIAFPSGNRQRRKGKVLAGTLYLSETEKGRIWRVWYTGEVKYPPYPFEPVGQMRPVPISLPVLLSGAIHHPPSTMPPQTLPLVRKQGP
jgi:hypothetical protein